MNTGQIVAAVLGCVAVSLTAYAVRLIRKAKQEKLIAEYQAAWDHPAGRRLCPPDDDPEFGDWAQRMDPG